MGANLLGEPVGEIMTAQTHRDIPQSAMVLAAGLGTRMRPLTNAMPKALVRVCGKALLDHALDALAQAGVARAVVNVHHFADQVAAHVAARTQPQVIVSDETARLLDSGGGVALALPHLGAGPFFVLNADTFWVEGYRPNLARLAQAWNDETMDILLLVSAMATAVGYGGKGDFSMDGLGRLVRRAERQIAPFAYAGAAIMHPRIFTDAPPAPFSLNLLFDRAIEAGRLHGLRMEGLWLHVGTPQAIREAETAISRSAA